MRVLKKYANRRLYDTQTSCYITLEDVQQLILQFQPVQVIDISTNEDITEQILLSIISNIESQRLQQKILTKALLEQLIRMYSYDNNHRSPLSEFLENSLRFYNDCFTQIPTPMHMWRNMAEQQYEIWQQAFGLNPGIPGGLAKPVGPTGHVGPGADQSAAQMAADEPSPIVQPGGAKAAPVDDQQVQPDRAKTTLPRAGKGKK